MSEEPNNSATDPATPPATPAADPTPPAATSAPTPAATQAPTPAPAATQAPTAAPTPDPKTLLADPKDKPAAAPADWPDDWREKMANGDEKLRTRLERFASPNDVLKAMRALESKTGELKKPLPDNPTEEQLNEWRKDNGIPEKADGYDLTLDGGLVIGEQDKPLVGKFTAEMHKANAKPEHVKAALNTYYQLVEEQQASQQQQDLDHRIDGEDSLRAEWGDEYRKNLTLATTLLDATAPVGFKDRIMGARLADGRLLGDDPEALKFLVSLAREVNPAASVVPGTAASNAPAAIADELAGLKTLMGDPSSDYWRGPKSAANQARYRELLSAQDRLKARG